MIWQTLHGIVLGGTRLQVPMNPVGSLLFALLIGAALMMPPAAAYLVLVRVWPKARHLLRGAAFGIVVLPLSLWMHGQCFVGPLEALLLGLPGIVLFHAHLLPLAPVLMLLVAVAEIFSKFDSAAFSTADRIGVLVLLGSPVWCAIYALRGHRADERARVRESSPALTASDSPPPTLQIQRPEPAAEATGTLARSWSWVALAALLALQLVTGELGLDFGSHWDERRFMVDVAYSARSGVLIPRYFWYPSMTWWLCAVPLPLTPRMLPPDSGPGAPSLPDATAKLIMKPWYALATRHVFVAVTALTILWVHLAVLALGRSRLEALTAAAWIATSWEVAYHARWVAPDAVLMQFGALTLLLCCVALRRRDQPLWLGLAAAAAGLGFSTKYQGGALLLPVLFAERRLACSGPDGQPRRGRSRLLIAICFAVYLLVTPGTLVDPVNFISHVLFNVYVYSTGYYGYSVPSRAASLYKNLEYLAADALSPYRLVSLAAFLLAGLGVARIARDRRGDGLVTVSFPAFYLLFMSMQRVLIVRNLLVLLPFLAIFSARGAVAALEGLRDVRVRRVAAALLACALAGNAAWLATAAMSIRHRNSYPFERDLRTWLNERPGTRVFLSRRVRSALAGLRAPATNLPSSCPPAQADLAIFYSYEGIDLKGCPANRSDLTERTFGPMEVNFNRYPTWQGNDRIVVMKTAIAREIGVPLEKLAP
ncbi:MAG: glycosyltransferase family 39 protein [Candidatus Wallbacteria bacterium]|nr:glycosyltransferase family 39 protein [Candidatus Wallbacteria bacterium]